MNVAKRSGAESDRGSSDPLAWVPGPSGPSGPATESQPRGGVGHREPGQALDTAPSRSSRTRRACAPTSHRIGSKPPRGAGLGPLSPGLTTRGTQTGASDDARSQLGAGLGPLSPGLTTRGTQTCASDDARSQLGAGLFENGHELGPRLPSAASLGDWAPSPSRGTLLGTRAPR